MACGGESETPSTSENNTITQDTAAENLYDTAHHEPQVLSEDIENKVWQIDDYVEKILKNKVSNSADEAYKDPENLNNLYYETLDIPGGYANVTGAFEGWYEFVLFRMADGNDLLGKMTVGCGPACSYDYEFKVYNSGQLVDENPDIFPKKEMEAHKEKMHQKTLKELEHVDYPEDAQLRYYFPQKGTDMQVNLVIGADEVEVKLLILEWDKQQFSIKKKFEKVEISRTI